MWELLIVFMLAGIKPQFLHAYDNAYDCQEERNRLGYLMAESYPWEHDFNIVCELKKSGTT
jgi:hypothetical protein